MLKGKHVAEAVNAAEKQKKKRIAMKIKETAESGITKR